LPGDPGLLGVCLGRGHDAARDEALPALIFAGEDKDRVAPGDVLASVHCLLLAERELLCPGISDLGFDREHPASPPGPDHAVPAPASAPSAPRDGRPSAGANGQPPSASRTTSTDRRSRFCSLAGTTMCSMRRAISGRSNVCDQDTVVPSA